MSRKLATVALLLMATATGCHQAPMTPAVTPAAMAAQEAPAPKPHKLSEAQRADVIARLNKAFPAEAVSTVKLSAFRQSGLNLLRKYYVSFSLSLKTDGGTEAIRGTYTPGKASLTLTLTKAQEAELRAQVEKTYPAEKRFSYLVWGEDVAGKLSGHAQVTLWTGPRTTDNVYVVYDYQTKKLSESPAK